MVELFELAGLYGRLSTGATATRVGGQDSLAWPRMGKGPRALELDEWPPSSVGCSMALRLPEAFVSSPKARARELRLSFYLEPASSRLDNETPSRHSRHLPCAKLHARPARRVDLICWAASESTQWRICIKLTDSLTDNCCLCPRAPSC